MEKAPACPQCGSRRVWRDGLRYTRNGAIQRWLCRNCGYRFSFSSHSHVKLNVKSQPSKLSEAMENLAEADSVNFPAFKPSLKKASFPFREDVGAHDFTNAEKDINSLLLHSRERRVSVAGSKPASKNSAKALVALSKEIEKEAMGPRGPTKLSENLKSELFNFAWWLRKNGLKETTIESKVKLLKVLVRRGANLAEPESVKLVIAKQNWSEGRKENAVDAYTSFLSFKGMEWNPPRYRRVKKLPFIPTEQELDQLIAGCSQRMACFLQLLKETGARAGEAWRLKWEDVDTATRTIRITPEKGSEPRIFHISQKLVAMLESLPKKYGEYVFATPNMKLRHHANHFSMQRKRLAQKLKNPRLLRIHFHTFRHWKATMEYARTRDIIHVMRLLGHKNIKKHANLRSFTARTLQGSAAVHFKGCQNGS